MLQKSNAATFKSKSSEKNKSTKTVNELNEFAKASLDKPKISSIAKNAVGGKVLDGGIASTIHDKDALSRPATSTLDQYLMKDVSLRSSNTALCDVDDSTRPLQFGVIAQQVDVLTLTLTHSLGLKSGDVVAMFAPAIMEFLSVTLSVSKGGGILLIIPPEVDVDVLSSILEEAKVTIVCTVPMLADTLRLALNKKIASFTKTLHRLKAVIICGGGGKDTIGSIDFSETGVMTYSFDSLIKPVTIAPSADATCSSQSIAIIVCTNGSSSGTRRLIKVSHAALISNISQLQSSITLAPGDVLLNATNAITWMFVTMCVAFVTGSTTLVMQNFKKKQVRFEYDLSDIQDLMSTCKLFLFKKYLFLCVFVSFIKR
jgi:acyl-coenzyme A synthetase/AMP-(fatty) acid ligase